jgi:hypothetical protein
METALAIALGLGLAAACGFRVFVPLLVVSAASLSGHLSLASGFEWIGSWPALIVFASATVLEIGAYYVPWLDNLLDTVATPAAVVAGIVVVASMVTDMSPWLQWSLAVIAGGGVAGAVQGGTVTTRAAASATTGGFGNAAVSTVEAGMSFGLSALSLALPFLALVAVVAILLFLARKVYPRLRRRRRRREEAAGGGEGGAAAPTGGPPEG